MSDKTTSVQVLLHLKGQGILDSPWETLPFRRIGWRWVGVELRRDWEEGWEGELWFECKVNKKLKIEDYLYTQTFQFSLAKQTWDGNAGIITQVLFEMQCFFIAS